MSLGHNFLSYTINLTQAQQTYLQEHLGNSQYLRSKECELADDLLQALGQRDLDRLDAVKLHPHLFHQDPEVQHLFKGLSVMLLDEGAAMQFAMHCDQGAMGGEKGETGGEKGEIDGEGEGLGEDCDLENLRIDEEEEEEEEGKEGEKEEVGEEEELDLS